MTQTKMPFVAYFELEPEPHLVAHECQTCSARYFDHRVACASCGATAFTDVDVLPEGEVTAFTIVHSAARGIAVPFVASTVDCGGTLVKGNIVNVDPDPDHVHVGMAVRLVAVPVGTDDDGVEAVSFGFEPQKTEV